MFDILHDLEKKERRIIQVLPTISFGDAVGNDTLAIRKILNEQGYSTDIYAENIDPRLPSGTAEKISNLKMLSGTDVLIYHASTGTNLNYELQKYGGKRIMIYHNITPPSFFSSYSPDSFELCKRGYEGVKYLADKIDYCIADSEYNKQELTGMGYKCPIEVCPIVIPFQDYGRKPDQTILDRYRNDGWINLLFVGRIAPNKKQEDIIRAFYYYQKYINEKSRLFLVGSDSGMEIYRKRLEQYVDLMGLGSKVIFPGHIQFSSILSYYRLANVFLCMSEHEGFCVPLVEAMYFGIPIIAYKSSAIPDTLGQGGILIDNKEPRLVATAIDRILKDELLCKEIREQQVIQLHKYKYENVKRQLLTCLNHFIGSENN